MAIPLLVCCIFLSSMFSSVESQGSNHTNQCYYCGEWDDAKQGPVTNPSHCRNIKACADSEVCSVTTSNTGGVIAYELGCKQLLICQIGNIRTLELHGVHTQIDLQHLTDTGTLVVGRKRQLHLCDVCCGDNLCNNSTCESVRRRLIASANANKLNYTTMTIIQ